MKPVITVYSGGSNNKTKRFDSIISAAFWAGVDYADEDINSVKVRQPSITDESDLLTLIEFASLLVQRQINFSVEFSTESREPGNPRPDAELKPRIPLLEPNHEDELRSEIPPLKKDQLHGP